MSSSSCTTVVCPRLTRWSVSIFWTVYGQDFHGASCDVVESTPLGRGVTGLLRSRSEPLDRAAQHPHAQDNIIRAPRSGSGSLVFRASIIMQSQTGGPGTCFPRRLREPRHLRSILLSLHDFQLWMRCYDVKRSAGYLCQLAGSEQRRPLGFLTDSRSLLLELYLGWPSLFSCGAQFCYDGPLLPKYTLCVQRCCRKLKVQFVFIIFIESGVLDGPFQ